MAFPAGTSLSASLNRAGLDHVPVSLSYGLSPPESRPKSQTLRVEHGVAVLRSTPPRLSSATTSPGTLSGATTPLRETVSPSTPIKERRPAWEEFEGERCTFLGYFLETVPESAGGEAVRIHYIQVQYFPEDGTLQIVEPPIANSGVIGGKLLSRRRVPKSALNSSGATPLNMIGSATASSPLKSSATGPVNPDEYITHEDLTVGMNLQLYGRTYHLWACEPHTRTFLQERFGIEQPADEDRRATFAEFKYSPYASSTTSSPFSVAAGQTSAGTSPEGDASETYYGRRLSPEKRFIEAQRGSSSAVLTRGIKDTLAQWLAHDSRDCLRFVGLIDERNKEGGLRHVVSVKHYLADDSIEVVEKQGPSSYEIMWKRGPLPKKEGLYHDSRGRDCFDDKGEGDYYHLGNLQLGTVMKMAGRKVLLVDCDEATLRHYREAYGIDMEGSKIDISEPAPEKPKPEVPPYLGWGDEADSMASVASLVPRRPKKNWTKLLAHSGEVLRFTAKFAEPRDVAEKERVFTISFEVATDSVTIFEPATVNSGIISNKFLQKTRLTNPDTGKPFTVEDFEAGRVLTLNAFKFRLLGPDTRTVELLRKLRGGDAAGGMEGSMDSPVRAGEEF